MLGHPVKTKDRAAWGGAVFRPTLREMESGAMRPAGRPGQRRYNLVNPQQAAEVMPECTTKECE